MFVFYYLLRQEGFGPTDADVNYVAVILNAVHTSTQDLNQHTVIAVQ